MTWRQWLALILMTILVLLGVVIIALRGRPPLASTTIGIGAVGLTYVVFCYLHKRQQRSKYGPTEACLRCGYDLTRINLPRCPECGALVGFKRSAEELGLDEGELHLKPRDVTGSGHP